MLQLMMDFTLSSFLMVAGRISSLVTQWERILLQCRRRERCGFDPWAGKIPRRRKWQPTPVFLPGESYGRRGLAGYGPWGHKESDTTEET